LLELAYSHRATRLSALLREDTFINTISIIETLLSYIETEQK
jgi:hypothetical protein